MNKDVIFETWSDEDGVYCTMGRKGRHYWIERVWDPWPGDGEVKRRFVPEMEALGYDPDPCGEAVYWRNPRENWHEDPELKPPWMYAKGAKYELVKSRGV